MKKAKTPGSHWQLQTAKARFSELFRRVRSEGPQYQLETWCDRDLIARFQGRILSTDLEVVQHWGRLAGRAVRQAAAMPVIDGLLAATAVYPNLTLVTRDTRHLEAAGISFFNPGEA